MSDPGRGRGRRDSRERRVDRNDPHPNEMERRFSSVIKTLAARKSNRDAAPPSFDIDASQAGVRQGRDNVYTTGLKAYISTRDTYGRDDRPVRLHQRFEITRPRHGEISIVLTPWPEDRRRRRFQMSLPASSSPEQIVAAIDKFLANAEKQYMEIKDAEQVAFKPLEALSQTAAQYTIPVGERTFRVNLQPGIIDSGTREEPYRTRERHETRFEYTEDNDSGSAAIKIPGTLDIAELVSGTEEGSDRTNSLDLASKRYVIALHFNPANPNDVLASVEGVDVSPIQITLQNDREQRDLHAGLMQLHGNMAKELLADYLNHMNGGDWDGALETADIDSIASRELDEEVSDELFHLQSEIAILARGGEIQLNREGTGIRPYYEVPAVTFETVWESGEEMPGVDFEMMLGWAYQPARRQRNEKPVFSQEVRWVMITASENEGQVNILDVSGGIEGAVSVVQGTPIENVWRFIQDMQRDDVRDERITWPQPEVVEEGGESDEATDPADAPTDEVAVDGAGVSDTSGEATEDEGATEVADEGSSAEAVTGGDSADEGEELGEADDTTEEAATVVAEPSPYNALFSKEIVARMAEQSGVEPDAFFATVDTLGEERVREFAHQVAYARVLLDIESEFTDYRFICQEYKNGQDLHGTFIHEDYPLVRFDVLMPTDGITLNENTSILEVADMILGGAKKLLVFPEERQSHIYDVSGNETFAQEKEALAAFYAAVDAANAVEIAVEEARGAGEVDPQEADTDELVRPSAPAVLPPLGPLPPPPPPAPAPAPEPPSWLFEPVDEDDSDDTLYPPPAPPLDFGPSSAEVHGDPFAFDDDDEELVYTPETRDMKAYSYARERVTNDADRVFGREYGVRVEGDDFRPLAISLYHPETGALMARIGVTMPLEMVDREDDDTPVYVGNRLLGKARKAIEVGSQSMLMGTYGETSQDFVKEQEMLSGYRQIVDRVRSEGLYDAAQNEVLFRRAMILSVRDQYEIGTQERADFLKMVRGHEYIDPKQVENASEINRLLYVIADGGKPDPGQLQTLANDFGISVDKMSSIISMARESVISESQYIAQQDNKQSLKGVVASALGSLSVGVGTAAAAVALANPVIGVAGAVGVVTYRSVRYINRAMKLNKDQAAIVEQMRSGINGNDPEYEHFRFTMVAEVAQLIAEAKRHQVNDAILEYGAGSKNEAKKLWAARDAYQRAIQSGEDATGARRKYLSGLRYLFGDRARRTAEVFTTMSGEADVDRKQNIENAAESLFYMQQLQGAFVESVSPAQLKRQTTMDKLQEARRDMRESVSTETWATVSAAAIGAGAAVRRLVPGMSLVFGGAAGWKMAGMWADKRIAKNRRGSDNSHLRDFAGEGNRTLESSSVVAARMQRSLQRRWESVLNGEKVTAHVEELESAMKDYRKEAKDERIAKFAARSVGAIVMGLGTAALGRAAEELGELFMNSADPNVDPSGVNSAEAAVPAAAPIEVQPASSAGTEIIPGSAVVENSETDLLFSVEGEGQIRGLEAPSTSAELTSIDYVVRNGEGISNPMIRQLESDPSRWGYTGDTTNDDAVHQWAVNRTARILRAQPDAIIDGKRVPLWNPATGEQLHVDEADKFRVVLGGTPDNPTLAIEEVNVNGNAVAVVGRVDTATDLASTGGFSGSAIEGTAVADTTGGGAPGATAELINPGVTTEVSARVAASVEQALSASPETAFAYTADQFEAGVKQALAVNGSTSYSVRGLLFSESGAGLMVRHADAGVDVAPVRVSDPLFKALGDTVRSAGGRSVSQEAFEQALDRSGLA